MATDEPITDIPLRLVGLDGNAFSILGRAREALRKARRLDLWDAFQKDATSGDYSHLLLTCLKYFDCDPAEEN